MKEDDILHESEISVKNQKIILEAFSLMPRSGIALRGDRKIRADELQEGFVEDQLNYIVFKLPNLLPKIWNNQISELFNELTGAIEMALVYADPWYNTGAFSRIDDFDFVSFVEYYHNNSSDLPAISWGVESYDGQFTRVCEEGRTWANKEFTHHTGDVKSFGIIPQANMMPIVLLDEQDIKTAQARVDKVIEEKNAELMKNYQPNKLLRFFNFSRHSDIVMYRYVRKEMRLELSKIASLKLCQLITKEFDADQ